MADIVAKSFNNLSKSKIWRRQSFTSSPVKLSLFAVSYLIAYGYGTLFLQTAAAPLWFPDSVLLCALLLTPTSEWWLYLTIAVPIRFIPAPHPAVPLWFVFATSANDILKAVFAAYLLRRLPNGSRHPSTMPQLATYLGVGVFVVPVVSAFAGAAARHSLGYSFWASWYQWFLGDALANVVLTPALLYWSSKHFRLRKLQTIELAVWCTGFALSLVVALALAQSTYSPIAVSVPVPFLIWAATRFGLIGASTSLSVIAVLATARIAEKTTLFSMGFESKSLLFLQVFLFVVSIPVLCIGALMEEKNSVEKSLRESEQRLRLAAQAGRMFAYSWDAATDLIERSGEATEILGVDSDRAATGAAISAMIHPEDRGKLEAALARLTADNPTLQITYRIVRPDGSVAWLQRSSRAYFDKYARLERIVGMIADVTERKLAEQNLSDMTRKFIESQEQERGRIGRELHDDINQRIAMLAIDLQQLQDNPLEIESRAQELRKNVGELGNDVQALSHDLHSSKLEYLGAIAGINSWCKEFAGRHNLEIEFRSVVSNNVPLPIGVSLLRVLQEALHNILKHSGARQVEVYLGEDSGEIHMIVKDEGVGFDVKAALQGIGLGLPSMRERVRLVNGTISINSKQMVGTTVHVRVPLPSAQDSQRAAG